MDGVYNLPHSNNETTVAMIQKIGAELYLFDVVTTHVGGDKYEFGFVYDEAQGIINDSGLQKITYSDVVGLTGDSTTLNVTHQGEVTLSVMPAMLGVVLSISDIDLLAYSNDQLALSSSGTTYSNISRFYYITNSGRVYEYRGSKVVNSMGSGLLYVDGSQYALFSQFQSFNEVMTIFYGVVPTTPIPSPGVPDVSCRT